MITIDYTMTYILFPLSKASRKRGGTINITFLIHPTIFTCSKKHDIQYYWLFLNLIDFYGIRILTLSRISFHIFSWHSVYSSNHVTKFARSTNWFQTIYSSTSSEIWSVRDTHEVLHSISMIHNITSPYTGNHIEINSFDLFLP